MRDSRRRIIQDLLVILREHELETLWSSFESGAELIAEIGRIEAALPDASAERELTGLFAPTGDLQEVAMGSGFHDAYMRLASRHDRVRR